MAKMQDANKDIAPEDSTIAWFFVLEKARSENNFERAAEAIRNLKRLGVSVKFSTKPEAVSHG